MSLSDPVQREHMHTRAIQIEGYRRADGLFDIEGHITDTKPYAIRGDDGGKLAAGTPLHGMWMRLTIDEGMTIVASEAWTEHGPFRTCPGGAESYPKLAGLTIKPGFLRAANERIGGALGCTHIREMLQQMATAAFQTMWPVRERRAEKETGNDGSTALIDTCFAYASDGAVVKRRWPHLYRGAAGEPKPQAQAGSSTG